MSAADYIAKFEEYMMRCDIQEDPLVTLSWFKTGLRADLQRELMTRPLTDLDEAYQVVQELEQYLKAPVVHRFESRDSSARSSSQGTRPNIGSQPRVQATIPPRPREDKGKGVLGAGPSEGSQVRCYECGNLGHMANQCPTKNRGKALVIGESHEGVDGQGVDYEVEEYHPEGGLTDEDGIDEEATLAVVRRVLSQSRSSVE